MPEANHALHLTRRERRGCNPSVPSAFARGLRRDMCAGSLSFDRGELPHLRLPNHDKLFKTLLGAYLSE